MSETAFSQGLLFALDTCLMLASEYCFSPLLFVYTWEEEQKFFFNYLDTRPMNNAINA